jgi:hypothetical protein
MIQFDVAYLPAEIGERDLVIAANEALYTQGYNSAFA